LTALAVLATPIAATPAIAAYSAFLVKVFMVFW
jgi:hypothetical protein